MNPAWPKRTDGASERQLREKLLEAGRLRGIGLVLVWRLDRWG